jgi:glucose-1-phosphate adenylyltransferase
VFQNFQSIEVEAPRTTLILSADHIYKMDYREMLEWHHKHRADVTIATIQVPPDESERFGVARIEEDFRIVGFEEKPQHGKPARSRFNGEMVSASMGVYLFRTEALLKALHEDAQDSRSGHDFARDIIPRNLDTLRVVAYDFQDINAKQVRYWRDVGTLDAYYDANMDLVSVTPEFNLYDQRWPIRTNVTQHPPAKFVFAQEGRHMGLAVDSVVSACCIVSGGRVLHSVLSPGVRVNSYCEVEYSILMPGVEVGRYSRIRRAILNTGAKVPESTEIGFDLEADRAKGHHVTENGIVVVA